MEAKTSDALREIADRFDAVVDAKKMSTELAATLRTENNKLRARLADAETELETLRAENASLQGVVKSNAALIRREFSGELDAERDHRRKAETLLSLVETELDDARVARRRARRLIGALAAFGATAFVAFALK